MEHWSAPEPTAQPARFDIFTGIMASQPSTGLTPIQTTSNNGTMAQPPLPRKSSMIPLTVRNTTSPLVATPSTETSAAEGDRNVNLSEYLDPTDRYLQQNPPKLPFFACQPGPEKRIGQADTNTGSSPAMTPESDPGEQWRYGTG